MKSYIDYKKMLFLYTLMKFGYEGESEIDFETFHINIITEIPYILEFLLSEGIVEKLEVNIYGEENNQKEIVDIKTLCKKESAHMKIFNKYSGPDLLGRNITFSFKTIIEKGIIEQYLNNYFDLWENDHFSLEYNDFIKPSIQLDKFANIVYKKIEEKGDRFKYEIDLYSNLDEISLITYIYLKGYINIKNDCVSHMGGNDLFFIVNTNDSISVFLNKYCSKKKINDNLLYDSDKECLIFKGRNYYLDLKKDVHIFVKNMLDFEIGKIISYDNIKVKFEEVSNKKITGDLKVKLNTKYTNLEKSKDIKFMYSIIESVKGEGYKINI